MSYIFVDVDGVLNPDELRSGGFEHEACVDGLTFWLKLHPVYAKWLLELSEKTGAELVWGSTWQEYANQCVGRPLGLPEMDFLPLKKRSPWETVEPVKARAAIGHAKGARFVYFDDWDLPIDCENGLLIKVNPTYGLMKRHIIEAEKWLRQGIR